MDMSDNGMDKRANFGDSMERATAAEGCQKGATFTFTQLCRGGKRNLGTSTRKPQQAETNTIQQM